MKTREITGDLSLIINDPGRWYQLSLQLHEPLWWRSDIINGVSETADLEILQASSDVRPPTVPVYRVHGHTE